MGKPPIECKRKNNENQYMQHTLFISHLLPSNNIWWKILYVEHYEDSVTTIKRLILKRNELQHILHNIFCYLSIYIVADRHKHRLYKCIKIHLYHTRLVSLICTVYVAVLVKNPNCKMEYFIHGFDR